MSEIASYVSRRTRLEYAGPANENADSRLRSHRRLVLLLQRRPANCSTGPGATGLPPIAQRRPNERVDAGVRVPSSMAQSPRHCCRRPYRVRPPALPPDSDRSRESSVRRCQQSDICLALRIAPVASPLARFLVPQYVHSKRLFPVVKGVGGAIFETPRNRPRGGGESASAGRDPGRGGGNCGGTCERRIVRGAAE